MSQVILRELKLNSAVKYVAREGFVNNFPITFAYDNPTQLQVFVGFKKVTTWELKTENGLPSVALPKDLEVGQSITIRRATPADGVPHTYQYKGNAQGGAEFSAKTIDENFEYMSEIVAEVEDYNTIAQDSLSDMEDKFKETQEVANSAKDLADHAVTTAERAEQVALGIDGKAQSALDKAQEALDNSETALTTALGIDGKAQEALDKSTTASQDSSNALTIALGIDGKAQEALDNSSEALTNANTALNTAQGVDGKAQEALDNSEQALLDLSNKRDIDDNVFDEHVSIESDGVVRGRMAYGNDGLQFEQVGEDGTQQTFNFPKSGEGGEFVLKQELANPAMGSAMVARGVVAVDSIADLLALPPGLRKSDLTYLLSSYWPGAFALADPVSFGGGTFKWEPAVPKSLHNGGTVIDPEVSWDGSKESHTSFLGGAASSGEGCFVRVLDGDSVSITDFGAIGDDNFDCYSAIQSALDSSNHVKVPEGRFKYTQTPMMSGTGSISGEGFRSVLRPHSCDGIKYTSSSVVGARFLRDLHFYAHGGEPHTGIVFDSGGDDFKRTTGVVVSGVYIAWFGEGVNAKGLWHSSFRNVVINSCIHGITLRGHCVSVDIGSCKIQTGNMTSSEDRYGVRVQLASDYDVVPNRQPEAIKIHSETLVFGFDYGVTVLNCLNFSLSNSDIDYSIKRGVVIENVTGGCSIRDNWIAGDGKEGVKYRGIEFTNLPRDTGQRKVVSGNCLSMTGTPVPDCRGIYLGSFNGNVTVEDNTIHAGFAIAVYIELNSTANHIRNNALASGTSLFIAHSGNEISGNVFGGRLTLHSSALRNDWGKNYGALTKEVFTILLPAGEKTATASLASLGLPSIVPNQQFVVSASYAGSYLAGAVQADINTDSQSISVYTEKAFGANQSIGVSLTAR